MSDYWPFLFALLVGALLGVFFFGGLWLTLRKMDDVRHPAWLMIGSFAGRTLVALGGFYLVAGERWERVAIALLGFVIARMVMVRVLRPGGSPGEEVKTRAAKS